MNVMTCKPPRAFVAITSRSQPRFSRRTSYQSRVVLQCYYAKNSSEERQSGCSTSIQHAEASRAVLLRGILGLGMLAITGNANAESDPEAPTESTRPNGYERSALRLVKGMRETIDLELSGADERKVRRKADDSGVKDLVKEFISKWQDNPELSSDESKKEIQAAITELGAFYMKNGQRTKLSGEASGSILAHLSAAEGLLPADADKKFLGVF